MNVPLQRSRLGRGLASLIGEIPAAAPARDSNAMSDGVNPALGGVASAVVPMPGARLPLHGEQRVVPIEQLRGGSLNPRRDFRDDDLLELADSIRAKGLVQPIIARPDPSPINGSLYEIVAGERRWRAAQLAGLHVLPVIVRDLDDRDVLEIAIIENVQRADLNAVEEASGYRELIERYGYSQEQLSEIIGKSRSHVANTLRLLKLPEAIQSLLQTGELTPGHARALVGRDDAEDIARRIIAEGLNVREVEAIVQGVANGPIGQPGSTGRKARDKDPDTKAFEKDLADQLGLRVEIKKGAGETGQLLIRYGSFDQLDYIRQRLTGGA
ncbi:MAG: ParB/RepB/Spo0J family partition protein [Hyphomicrobiaceae bacterium]|nr:ParB/RepB/Spo0J family partition protein [Hyphomicrobiaceae bacterium]